MRFIVAMVANNWPIGNAVKRVRVRPKQTGVSAFPTRFVGFPDTSSRPMLTDQAADHQAAVQPQCDCPQQAVGRARQAES
jgi:hypothetical protein